MAALLAATYLFIALSPLAPLAMHSKVFAYAVTGECSGDCGVCGCPSERSAARTCCCWQKKLQQAAVQKQPNGGYCSQKVAAVSPMAGDRGSYPKPASTKNEGCCEEDDTSLATQDVQEPPPQQNPTSTEIVYKCALPCGKGKVMSLTSCGLSELLPATTIATIAAPDDATHYTNLSPLLISRYDEPPDPPPKLSVYS